MAISFARLIKGMVGLIVVLIITIVGVKILIPGHAQTPYGAVEAESGNVGTPASVQNDSSASGGKYVQFGPPAVVSSGILLGLDTPPSNISTAISEIGKTPNLINEFDGWQTDTGASIPFPTADANNIISLGATPMITWQPSLNSWESTSVLTSISNGSQDAYITAWAQAAKAENHTVYVRLMHEFNGQWYPWGAVTAGVTPLSKNQFAKNNPTGTYPYTNTAQMYTAAYDHVVKIFQQVGASNVQFMWCFATSASLTNISSYYPGDSDVSWASMDGYNRNTSSPALSFAQIFTPGYNDIISFTKRPIFIAETGSVEYSGFSSDPTSKAQWITDGFLNNIPNTFTHIKGINYFDSVGAGYTYPIDTSAATLSAIKQVYTNKYYQGTAPTSSFFVN